MCLYRGMAKTSARMGSWRGLTPESVKKMGWEEVCAIDTQAIPKNLSQLRVEVLRHKAKLEKAITAGLEIPADIDEEDEDTLGSIARPEETEIAEMD